MKHVSPVLEGATVIVGKLPSREALIEACILVMGQRANQDFRVMHDVEGLAKKGLLAGTSVVGTIFEPMTQAIQDHGASIGDTIGDLQQALDIDDQDIHDLACFCHELKPTMKGSAMAENLLMLQAGTLKDYRGASYHSF